MPSLSSQIPEKNTVQLSYESTQGDVRGILAWVNPDGSVQVAMGRHLTHRDFRRGVRRPSREERTLKNGLSVLVDKFDRNSAIALHEALDRLLR